MAADKKAALTRTQTFHDHLKELRLRVFAIAMVFILASGMAYNYKDTLITLLLAPLGDQKLMFLTPAGGFSFIFQISLYAGLIVTIPVVIYNLYRFISPILSKRAQRYSLAVIAASLILLIVGAGFGYVYAIPAALKFLTHFADGFITASLTADSYLSFVVTYTVGLAVLFQLPLILLFIHWIHPLKPSALLKFEKYMILIAFILAAMITPTPDLLNQVIVAAPIILMYQIGVVAVCMSVYRRKKASQLKKPMADRVVKVGKSIDLPLSTHAPSLVAPSATPAAAQPAMSIRRPQRSVDGLLKPSSRPLRSAVVVPRRTELVVNTAHSRPRMTRSLDGVSLFAVK